MRDVSGRFLPGPDPGRHPLTREERIRGYNRTVQRYGAGDLLAPAPLWLLWRCKAAGRRRRAAKGGS